MSGMDIVYQVWPGFPEGRIDTPFGTWDLDFFRWALPRMASSAAHADPRKAGLTMCELFGAYGWQLGLRDMKWITDFACSRGINFLVPHAFSPKFPDPDCPPHYYARGNNPQWRLFGTWSSYAERLCHLLSGGEHVAPVAVLYHAEAEWAGDCERVETVIRSLSERQVDCDVVSVDSLLDPAVTRADAGSFTVNRETFSCLVVPFARRLPAAFLRFLPVLLTAGVRVVFTGSVPEGASDADLPPSELAVVAAHPGATLVTTEALGAMVEGWRISGVSAIPTQPHLRTYRYRGRGADLIFCFNEDPRAAVDTRLDIDDPREPFAYDALTDACHILETVRTDGRASVRLRLEPYGSLFIVFGRRPSSLAPARLPPLDFEPVSEVAGPWTVSTCEALQWPRATARPGVAGPGDISQVKGLEDFAGTIVYETGVSLPPGECWLDVGQVGESSQVWLDGAALGTRICPPHRYLLPGGKAGPRVLRVEVTTTLARRLGANVFDRAMAQEPMGLLGPVRILRATPSAKAGRGA
jgi:hypothetical protein